MDTWPAGQQMQQGRRPADDANGAAARANERSGSGGGGGSRAGGAGPQTGAAGHLPEASTSHRSSQDGRKPQQPRLSGSQHPRHNPTPFAAFATDLGSLYTTPVEFTSQSSRHPTSIVIPPSELLPPGLLTTPTPSMNGNGNTQGAALLRMLQSTRGGGRDVGSDEQTTPVATLHLAALGSLALPSPSLLPGGVPSLPTPTASQASGGLPPLHLLLPTPPLAGPAGRGGGQAQHGGVATPPTAAKDRAAPFPGGYSASPAHTVQSPRQQQQRLGGNGASPGYPAASQKSPPQQQAAGHAAGMPLAQGQFFLHHAQHVQQQQQQGPMFMSYGAMAGPGMVGTSPMHTAAAAAGGYGHHQQQQQQHHSRAQGPGPQRPAAGGGSSGGGAAAASSADSSPFLSGAYGQHMMVDGGHAYGAAAAHQHPAMAYGHMPGHMMIMMQQGMHPPPPPPRGAGGMPMMMVPAIDPMSGLPIGPAHMLAHGPHGLHHHPLVQHHPMMTHQQHLQQQHHLQHSHAMGRNSPQPFMGGMRGGLGQTVGTAAGQKAAAGSGAGAPAQQPGGPRDRPINAAVAGVRAAAGAQGGGGSPARPGRQQQQQQQASPAQAQGPAGGLDAQAKKRRVASARVPPLGSPPVVRCDLGLLEQQLQQLVAQLVPQEEELERHQRALEGVRTLVHARWPEARVTLFGSAANTLLVSATNDIDVCLEMPEVGLDDVAAKGAIISELAVMLGPAAEGGAGMEDVVALPKARVPVIKFVFPETQTRVDITVNNILALHNTRLLRDYAQVDVRLRQLVLLVKHWAKTRAVNDAYRGSLSSYAYVLLCIFVLQQRSPPVLPVLQAMQPHTFDVEVGPWRCAYHDAIDTLRGFGAANTETLAELFVLFFDHWAWRHDYNHSVVSVRTGTTMPKAAKDWTRRQGSERHLMCIEDPFMLNHDLGRTIDKAAVQILRDELERAARLLIQEEQPLDVLLQKVTPPPLPPPSERRRVKQLAPAAQQEGKGEAGEGEAGEPGPAQLPAQEPGVAGGGGEAKRPQEGEGHEEGDEGDDDDDDEEDGGGGGEVDVRAIGELVAGGGTAAVVGEEGAGGCAGGTGDDGGGPPPPLVVEEGEEAKAHGQPAGAVAEANAADAVAA